jgi:hypothetical protein
MKTTILTMVFVFCSIPLVAQTQPEATKALQQKPISENKVYQLFPTKNFWTFIKLDTRNGRMWQVHFSLKEDGNDGEYILNLLPLVSKDKEVNGRFTLYPTENIYNFLLLDQIDGKVYQAQWSMDVEKRFVVPIR